MVACIKASLLQVVEVPGKTHVGALINRIGFGAHYTINIIRNPPAYYW